MSEFTKCDQTESQVKGPEMEDAFVPSSVRNAEGNKFYLGGGAVCTSCNVTNMTLPESEFMKESIPK